MKRAKTAHYLSVTCLLLMLCCSDNPPDIHIDHLFTLMPDSYTHLEFTNKLVDELHFNVFKYRNYYNGGGVAIGDLNGDGLPDVYLTANQQANRLFLNEGAFRFRDVTSQARVAGSHNWSTGICLADVDGDGRLDIYVCNSGNIEGDDRANELFLNQGNDEDGVPTFKEVAAEYGIDDRGFSTHATFFDYDRDGDLDLYVLNNIFRPLSTFNLAINLRQEPDSTGGSDRLYINDLSSVSAPRFTDVTRAAGIHNSVIAFGMGVSVSDINNDHWPDIYVANDFFERDYLYINNHDGTFAEKLEEMMGHVSLSSMGGDIADLNNDGLMDVFATDMLPEDDYRLKTTFTFDSFDFIEKQIEWGYYFQLSQNVLQLNNGIDSHGQQSFSEIGMFAGVAQTDWSWGALVFDMDNDGLKDIFVSNGIFRDVTDQDYLELLMDRGHIRKMTRGERIDFPELIKEMPSTKLRNYAFRNNGDMTFCNEASKWGLDQLSFSNGSAYGDLDGDGDNDIVVNNVNQPVFVLRNEADSLTANHYLKVKLVGGGLNPFAIGSRVTLKCGAQKIFMLEQMPSRGFQSSVDYGLTLGLGEIERVDTLVVDWPDGTCGMMTNVASDQTVTITQGETGASSEQSADGAIPSAERTLLRDVSGDFPLHYRHVENAFADFQREPLIPHKLSTEGPCIEKIDVNGDGFEDVYLGGAKGQAGELWLQTGSGGFIQASDDLFKKNSISEDVDATFFDADGDRDLDLYVVSGGNEYATRAPALLDRLYINDGGGRLHLAVKALPVLYASGSCVEPADFDNDGDVDLFVGSRSVPWNYGLSPASYLLVNDGKGVFSVASEDVAPGFSDLGMVTGAQWLDWDKDNNPDLAVVGEWMPVTLFRNAGGKLVNVTEKVGLQKTEGWWNCIVVTDLNEDGYEDLVCGNLGLNSKLHASATEPASLYVYDFNNDGLVEPILCYYRLGKSYPMALRSDLADVIPAVKYKFPRHVDFADKQLADVFTEEELGKAVVKHAYCFASTIFFGRADSTFVREEMPAEAQFSPVYTIVVDDFDGDGARDILLAGNFYNLTPQLGRYDASHGVLLKGDKGDGFASGHSVGSYRLQSVPVQNSGLFLTGQIRDAISLARPNGGKSIIFAGNDEPLQVFQTTIR